ncbi:unnamed protein product [Rotaria sp. Silwood2]|nr:unnamed protein product [Rotaria sp. Silwood2]
MNRGEYDHNRGIVYLVALRRVMTNSGFNVVILTDDRTVFFDQDNQGRYGHYDLHILENSDETFGRVVLSIYESSKIESSISRKAYLLETMFIETNTSNRKNQTTSSSSAMDKQPVEPFDQMFTESSTNQINSIVNLNDNQICQISLENLKSLSPDNFIKDELDDDDEIQQKLNDLKENFHHVLIDENEEKKLSYYERTMLNYQRSILDKLETLNIRLTAVAQSVSLLYERQSMTTLIKLLNESYLIDIRQLDTRILSSLESEEMHLFFRYVASFMKNDYSHRWNSIKDWLYISLRPKSIEYNLLGFGKLEKTNRSKQMKIIKSPVKLTNLIRYNNRSSYATFENNLSDNDKNLIVVFEAITSKIYFTSDALSDINDRNDKYNKSMKKLMHKLYQLERQIYYLSFYYSIGLHQFFAGLILFELYRNPSINPDELLNKIMSSEVIRLYVPLTFRLFKINQFILTY